MGIYTSPYAYQRSLSTYLITIYCNFTHLSMEKESYPNFPPRKTNISTQTSSAPPQRPQRPSSPASSKITKPILTHTMAESSRATPPTHKECTCSRALSLAADIARTCSGDPHPSTAQSPPPANVERTHEYCNCALSFQLAASMARTCPGDIFDDLKEGKRGDSYFSPVTEDTYSTPYGPRASSRSVGSNRLPPEKHWLDIFKSEPGALLKPGPSCGREFDPRLGRRGRRKRGRGRRRRGRTGKETLLQNDRRQGVMYSGKVCKRNSCGKTIR